VVDLNSIRAFVFDLDGCVYAGNELLPGVADVLTRLRSTGRRVCFLTNNSRETGPDLLGKLARLGIAAAADEIISAAEVTGPYLTERFGPSRLLAVGSPQLLRLLGEAGHSFVPFEGYREARVVVIGHDGAFDYAKLTGLARAVRGGAAFVAVNRDPRLPVEGGEFFPGCGAMVEAVAVVAGVQPEVVGKPQPYAFRVALARLGLPADGVAMVGDSPISDIRGAQGVGLKTIWLAPPDADADAIRPDLTIRSFAELAPRL
jgi:HAD superfamily hydrolase (TIGR01450 family)